MLLVIFFLTLLFTLIDFLRRFSTVDRVTEKILSATDRIATGDFSVRLHVEHAYEKYNQYDEIMENLNKVKEMVDDTIYYNVHVLGNAPVFNQDVLRAVSLKLNEMNITASLEDRKFIQRQIAEEYLSGYNMAM
jgi:nitrogen fixation/metabolism regulation signal transduction histidine kinase